MAGLTISKDAKGYERSRVGFTEAEFIGKTVAEAVHLKFEKDRAYLRDGSVPPGAAGTHPPRTAIRGEPCRHRMTKKSSLCAA
jgi:hypothetical protein